MHNTLFILAALINALAALTHIWPIFKGADAYRTLGAGEYLAQKVEAGHLYPHLLSFGIASILFFFTYLCLSSAIPIPQLPYTREILWALTAVYLLRGIYPFLMMKWVHFYKTRFFIFSSLIVFAMGIAHLLALMTIPISH